MPLRQQNTLRPVAELGALRPGQRMRAVFLPALAPFPRHTWPLVALLPVLGINDALRQALAARRPFRVAPPIAGLFACDPFLRTSDMAAALRKAGIAQVVNWPTVQVFGGETAAALAAVGYRAEAEFRVLARMAGHGIAPIACATSLPAADTALALGLRRILLHPGLVRPADHAAWWRELAGHVAIEGGEALAWDDAALLPQISRPSRRMRL